MKNLTKIFMAVAVALFAFSCVQDATEDLGVKVGGQTELTLSIEESRTQLGEKAGSLYPVTWCEGDVVAVNGVASTGIEIKEGGKAATFTFPEAIARPWSVVYPATTAIPVTEGLQAVTFLATQEYKVGTFCDGAAPMYGVAAAAAEGEEAPAVQLNHLTGVLRFAVKGAGEKLTAMTVTTESGKIAGNFDVDCATGALTAHEDATNVVTVTFGEGLTLGEVATPIYVAVPAGEYGVVTVVLATDDAKKMTAKFSSNTEKQIKAGVVREFAEFVFAENDIDNKWFEIYTVADMLAFAKTATNFPYVGAKVMASIDMTGVEWTPIDGFGKVFDGGNENAHVEGDNGIHIKGLSAPLFGTTSATIQNLKLTGVNITETAERFVGAVARYIENGAVKNCKAEGTLVMNSTTNYGADADNRAASIGGIVGRSVGSALYNCYNKVAITFTSSCDPASTTALSSMVGGVVGLAYDATTVENCTNDAKILFNGTTTPAGKSLYLCGVVGYSEENNDTKLLKNILNTENGDIEFAEAAIFTGTSARMYGCVGVVYDGQTAVENIVNRGDISFLGTANSEIRVAGIANNLGGNTSTIKKLENYGNIYISGTAKTDTNYIAGIAGHTAGAVTHKIEDCHNHGDIYLTSANLNKNMYCGGLISCNTNGTAQLVGCTNNGAIIASGTMGSSASYFGGIIGYVKNTAASLTKCVNNGSITLSGTLNESTYCGGLLGWNAEEGSGVTLTDCENKGAITASGTFSKPYIGGLLGYNSRGVAFNNCINSGAITFSGSASTTYLSAFLSSGTSSNTTWTDCENKGTITHSGTSSGNVAWGGFLGYAGGSSKPTWNNCTNSGTLSFTGWAKSNFFMGGFFGYPTAGAVLTWNSCVNKGDVSVTGKHTNSADKKTRVGGFVGGTYATCNFYSCTNEGNVTINLSEVGEMIDIHAGGFVGDVESGWKIVLDKAEGSTQPCLNKGTITLSGTYTDSCRAGGFVATADQNSSGCLVKNAVNEGEIKADKLITAGSLIIGGIMGYAAKEDATQITNATNTGKLTVTNSEPASLYVGGICGCVEAGKAPNGTLKSACDITISNVTTTKNYRVGGIMGSYILSTSISNAQSLCNISAVGLVEGTTMSSDGKTTYTQGLGMIIGNHRGTTAVVSGCKIGGKYAITAGADGKPEWKTISADVVGKQNDEGDLQIDPNFTPFWNKIYGGTWAEAGIGNCDGCSYISKIE